MKKIKCCISCPDRSVSCHCTCQKYEEEKKAVKEDREKIAIDKRYHKLFKEYRRIKFSA